MMGVIFIYSSWAMDGFWRWKNLYLQRNDRKILLHGLPQGSGKLLSKGSSADLPGITMEKPSRCMWDRNVESAELVFAMPGKTEELAKK